MVKKQKYIFVTGGVLSGVGKGITAASIGAVLQAKGVKVSIQKCDPYLNVDAGLLNPAEHGECYVTKDGAETDLDLGHYERFLDIELTQKNATLAGRLLSNLIADERAGKFGGKTVQLIPHLTGAIQEAIIDAGQESDIHIVEIGGTVGDYEGLSFVEAIRELSQRVGRDRCMFVHVVYVPFLGTSKEFKTKPAQNALNDLRGFGIVPDAVMIRTDDPAPQSVAEKISLFGGIPIEHTQLLPNIDTVYQVPVNIAQNGVYKLLARFAGVTGPADLSRWHHIVNEHRAEHKKIVTVGLVAKYIDNVDTYYSVVEAIKAASWHEKVGFKIEWINAETATQKDFEAVDALLVPGGFGTRGTDGKIAAARYALDNNKPYLGICLGLQVAVIAAARKAGVDSATSHEFDRDGKDQVVYIMNGQDGKQSTGGTMRLGDYNALLKKDSKVANLYGKLEQVERHRHRYEVNQKYLADIEKGGIVVSGTSPDGFLVEYIEAKNHPYFVATQAHPEFRSRPYRAHPLFIGLISAAK